MKFPEAGEIHWVSLDPTMGTEQAGRRPALIVSDQTFNERSPRVLVCPITSRVLDWPVVALLPDDLRTKGVVLCDQIRALDQRARLHGFIERAPDELLDRVRAILGAILNLETAPRA